MAEKSPLSVRSIKQNLRYTRDHTVADSLDYVAICNAATLLSSDLDAAFGGVLSREKPAV